MVSCGKVRVLMNGVKVSEYTKGFSISRSTTNEDYTGFEKMSRVYSGKLRDTDININGWADDSEEGLYAKLEQGMSQASSNIFVLLGLEDGASGFFSNMSSGELNVEGAFDSGVNVTISGKGKGEEAARSIKVIHTLSVSEDQDDYGPVDIVNGGSNGAVIYVSVQSVNDEMTLLFEHSDVEGEDYTSLSNLEIVESGLYKVNVSGTVKSYIKIGHVGDSVESTINYLAAIHIIK